MSDILYERNGLVLSRFTGPAGGDRRRWQITTPLPDGFVQMDLTELLRLFHAVGNAFMAAAEEDQLRG